MANPLQETEAQRLARLNPTSTTVATPTNSGYFRAVGGYGDAIYKMNPDGISYNSYDILELGRQALLAQDSSKDAYGNYKIFQGKNGEDYAGVGVQVLKDKYGINYSSLGQQNLADLMYSGKSANGNPFNDHMIGKAGSLSDLFQAQPKATFGTQTINNTPNTLATPLANIAGGVQALPNNGGAPGGTSVPVANDFFVKKTSETNEQYLARTQAYIAQRNPNDPNSARLTMPQSSIGNPATPPTGGGASAPTLPTPSGASAADLLTQGLSAQLASQKAQFEAENTKRANEYQAKIDALDKKQSDLQGLQDLGMSNLSSTVTKESEQKRAALDLEKQRVDENYNANQSLINEMDGLLTTGNQVIQQMRDTTGLASIMNPRITKTMTDVTARAGVIQAVLAARNGQIGVAQNQLASTLSAITSIYGDQIDYYKTLQDFYSNQKTENGTVLAKLNTDQKAYLDMKLTTLAQDVDNTQKTADLISKALLNPDTALDYAKAGISLTDSPMQIAQKLAVVAQAKVLEWTDPYMLGGDMVQRSKITGAIKTVVNVPVGGVNLAGKTLDPLDVGRYLDLYPDSGITTNDTKASADAKVAAVSIPEGALRVALTKDKNSNIPYETTVKGIKDNKNITDKTLALRVASEVYGKTTSPTEIETPIYGIGNFAKIPLDTRVNEMKTFNTSNGIPPLTGLREDLAKEGYPIKEIDKRLHPFVSGVNDLVDSISSYLFGK